MSTVSGGRRRAFRSRHHAALGKGGRAAVIFFTVALVLLVFAVFLGNYLRGLAQDILDNTTPAQTDREEVYYANSPDNMIGRGVIFGFDHGAASGTGESAESAEDTTDYAPDPIRFDAVSTALRYKDKASGEKRLAYNSPIASAYSIDTLGQVELSDGLDLIASDWGEMTRVCGIFEVDYLNDPDQIRPITRAYELALVGELVDAGFDEILLIGFSGNTDEGLSFISDIYEQKGRGTAIGLCLSFDFINSYDAEEKLEEITSKCGFLALDLYTVDVPVLMDAESLISDRVGRTGFICSEFSIRILLGCGESPNCESQTRAAIEAGSKNVMTALRFE